MRFLIDECTGPAVAEWLRSQHHDVFSVFAEARGITDDEIIKKAFAEQWILITNDKDFGEKIYREQYSHHGVIFLRLDDEHPNNRIAVLQHGYALQKIKNIFAVTNHSCQFVIVIRVNSSGTRLRGFICANLWISDLCLTPQ